MQTKKEKKNIELGIEEKNKEKEDKICLVLKLKESYMNFAEIKLRAILNDSKKEKRKRKKSKYKLSIFILILIYYFLKRL